MNSVFPCPRCGGDLVFTLVNRSGVRAYCARCGLMAPDGRDAMDAMRQWDRNASVRTAGIEEESIVDGPGMRLTLFCQGCLQDCKGCQNPQTHDVNAGKDVPVWDIVQKTAGNPLCAGITLSGGEPFLQAEKMCRIADAVHANGQNVLAFSGYCLKDLLQDRPPFSRELLSRLDWLVDGPYIEAEKSLDLPLMGSRNQTMYTRDEIQKALEKTR